MDASLAGEPTVPPAPPSLISYWFCLSYKIILYDYLLFHL